MANGACSAGARTVAALGILLTTATGVIAQDAAPPTGDTVELPPVNVEASAVK
jgi:hypothetical protein